MMKSKDTCLTLKGLCKRAEYVSRAQRNHSELVEGIRQAVRKDDYSHIETKMRDFGVAPEERKNIKDFILSKKKEVIEDMERSAKIDNDPLIRVIRHKPMKEKILAIAALSSDFSFQADKVYEKYSSSSNLTLSLRLLMHNFTARLIACNALMSTAIGIVTNSLTNGAFVFSISSIVIAFSGFKFFKDNLRDRAESRKQVIPEDFTREVFDRLIEDKTI